MHTTQKSIRQTAREQKEMQAQVVSSCHIFHLLSRSVSVWEDNR